MRYDVAESHALGYAAGREDASGTRTGGDSSPGARDGWLRYAHAFAQGWDDLNHERRVSMTNAKDAYDRWQESGGRSIFRCGDLTLPDDQRAELRSLWPGALDPDPDYGPYHARQAELQAAAWEAASPERDDVADAAQLSRVESSACDG